MSVENTKLLSGMIVKLIGGIYFVDAPDGIYECTARGVFRNKGLSPCCGDKVAIEVLEPRKGVITELQPRKNEIIRPPLANLDNLVLVTSTCDPAPNLLLLDKFIAVAEFKGIEPILVFTKSDLRSADELCDIYRNSGIEAYAVSDSDSGSADAVKKRLTGQLSAFTGNTGVGKTTLLNSIFPELGEKTAEISRKLGRGRHTTRHVSLYKLDGGGYIADTPGFSSFETGRYDVIFKDELAECFREFRPHLGKCRFVNCSHTKESGCAVLEALQNGEIQSTRHESYVTMYNEARLIPEWQYKQNKQNKKK